MEKLELDQRITEKIQDLLKLYTHYGKTDVAVHDMEKGLLSSLLSLGLVLLKLIIEKKSRDLENVSPEPIEAGELLKNKGLQHRVYLSVFGEFSIYRTGYYSKQRGNYYELDSRFQLPKSKKLSYNLQELLGLSSTEQNYRKSVKILNSLLGLNISSTQSKRNAQDLGQIVEQYYENLEEIPIEEKEEVIHFCAYFDGKGVPMIQENTKKVRELKRLGIGEKKGKKRMATVSVNAHFIAKKRNKDSIIRGLMDYPKKAKQEGKVNDNRWLQGIHRRAFLMNQARAVEYGLDNIRKAMTNPLSRFIVPIDAGSGLEDKVIEYVNKYNLTPQFDGIILDIIHVVEYLWDAANSIFEKKDKERTLWVRQNLSQLLESKTTEVIEQLEKIKQEKNITNSKNIDSAISYFFNHAHKMDYKKFIDKGYPISSALAESTCGHLVKDRMEGAGKRWNAIGAQNMMDLRAVNINGDFDDFMKFAIKSEQDNMFKKVA